MEVVEERLMTKCADQQASSFQRSHGRSVRRAKAFNGRLLSASIPLSRL